MSTRAEKILEELWKKKREREAKLRAMINNPAPGDAWPLSDEPDSRDLDKTTSIYEIPLPDRIPGIVWPELEPGSQLLYPPPTNLTDLEAVPPVPHDLRNREWVYGYIITDELMEAYWLANPQARPGKHICIPNNYSVYGVARQLALDIWIDEKNSEVESIAWYSCTMGGKIRIDKVPTAARREAFEKALGIKEKAQWLSTKIPLILVCVRVMQNTCRSIQFTIERNEASREYNHRVIRFLYQQ
ncbi:hypothetical protein GGX14DRAFT_391408 [Mycena pura]|uniref:Uncharacterized protein n=1 Tax=Mycena pura TaxID=153505 RepID=A0AAD6VLL9_9AGAR|nr:hypothetical protein GGX14DRAFT_391408 [Mycena pura]